MTISTTSNTVVVQGNGLVTSFDFTFPVPLASELFVYYTDTTGAQTLLSSTQYSVTGIGTANGGAVTYPLSGSPIASGTSLTIQRVVQYQQLTDLVNQSGYYPNVVENALDYLTMQTQQLAQAEALALTVPLSSAPASLVLPAAASRAGKLVGFDANGNAVVYPVSASVGAGNLTSEGPFVAGTNFTPGVTTTLTLSQSYGAPANVQVHFDGIYQGPDQYTLNGNQIVFTSAIPVGTSKVYIVGGTTLSVNAPANNTVTDASLASGSNVKLMSMRAADFVSARDGGCVEDGATDDTANLLALITSIGSKACTLMISGALLVSSNVTFGVNTELQFLQSGSIQGKTGAEVVTTYRQPVAGRHQIFANCVAAAANIGHRVFPEWYGAKADGATSDTAAFNNAYGYLGSLGGVIEMASATYALATPINNVKPRVELTGPCPNGALLLVTGTNQGGIVAAGSSGSPIASPSFKKFNITSNTAGTTNTGIILQYTALARLEDIQITNFFQGMYMQRATNTFQYRMGTAYTAATNGFIGWVIDGGGTGVGGNASSTWRDCYCQGSAAYNGPTGQIGFKPYGAYVSDLYFSNCATAETNYGYYLDYSSATAGGYADIIIQNPVVDGFTAQGIFVNQMPAQQMLTVIGGWIDPVSVLAETDGIYLNACIGRVKVIGVQFSGEANYAYAVGVRVINSVGASVSGCVFNDHNYSIKESGSSFCIYQGNSLVNASSHPATAQISITGGARTMCVANSHDGYATNSVVADNTSTGVGVTSSTFNAATLAAPRVLNNSSGPIGGSDGSTGLNSGV